MEDTEDTQELEILRTYELLGLSSMEARSHFTGFAHQKETTRFDVVISTTSTPLAR